MAWWGAKRARGTVDVASNTARVEARSGEVSISDPNILAMLGYAGIGSATVSESTALTLSAVFRAASIVSESIAALPLRTIQEDSDGQKTRAKSWLDNPAGPAGIYTPHEWKSLVVLHLLFHGNAYLQHIRNGAGALVGLNPIHPACVTPEWDDSRPGGKRFTVQLRKADGGAETVDLDPSTMTQIMGMSFDGLKGLSVIALARTSMGTGLSGDKAAYRQFTNGAMISGMVTVDGDEDLTEPEAQTVKDMVNQKITGVENAGDIPVLNKRLKFTPWTLSAVDAQFLESRVFAIDEIGRWFGVPPHLLGLTEKATSWGQGIAEQNRGLARYTLSSWTSRIDERLTPLISSPSKTAEFDFSAFVESAPEDEIRLLIEQMNSGLLTPNEARKIRNLPPLAGGDIPRFPAGSAPPVDPNAKPEEVAA